MVRVLDPNFQTALEKEVLTLAWVWQITRIDGLQMGFTSLDMSIEIDGLSYFGYSGFDPGASQVSQGVEKLDSQTLKGILDRSGVSQRDLDSGIYENAKLRRFLIDYTDLPNSFEDTPPKFIELPECYLGSRKRNSLGYEIQAKDILSLLDNNIGTTTTKTCRASLGDRRCRVDLSGYTHDVTVTAVFNRRVFEISITQPPQYFDRGRGKFTSGENENLYFDIMLQAGNQISLSFPAPFPLQVGDSLTVVAGCTKTKLACIKFRNYYNFVGEDDVPTTDLAVNTPKK